MIIRDWDALNATEMPQWIVGLTSNDEKRQFQAKMKLSTYLGQHALALNTASDAYNQVLETDAPVLLTSLLIEMLKDESTANPRYITELLEIVISFIKEPALNQAQRKRAEKIYQHVAQEFNVYLDLLKHPDSEVRLHTMEILSQISEKQEDTARALLLHVKSKVITDEIEKLTAIGIIFNIVQAKSEIIDLKTDFIEVLNNFFEDNTALATELARAACYLILLQENQVSPKVITTLTDILKEANFTDPLEDLLLSTLWIEALLSLGINQATDTLLDIFNDQTDEYALVEIGAFLLELQFGSGDIQAIYLLSFERDGEKHISVSRESDRDLAENLQQQNFSSQQKQVLKHFVRKDQFWNIKTNLLELFFLPLTQAELEKLT